VSSGNTHKSRQRTPWDEKEGRTAMQEFLYQHHQKRYEERHPKLRETGETELINSYGAKNCPYCESAGCRLHGHTGNGVRRYMCRECGQTFTPVTGTMIDWRELHVNHLTPDGIRRSRSLHVRGAQDIDGASGWSTA